MRQRYEPNLRAAAVSMLSRGIATTGEIARLALVKPQLVDYWARAAGLDWKASRQTRLYKEWRRATGVEEPEKETRVKLRQVGAAAKKEWDQRELEWIPDDDTPQLV